MSGWQYVLASLDNFLLKYGTQPKLKMFQKYPDKVCFQEFSSDLKLHKQLLKTSEQDENLSQV